MLVKNKIPVVRAKMRSDGSIMMPKGVRELLDMEHKDVIAFGLFEILKHGEVSELSSFTVSFG